jgi:D-apionolactonase
MSTELDHFAFYGTHQRETQPVLLTAGRLSAEFAGGNLTTISYDGVEVLRAISYLVRDQDWGTHVPLIDDLRIRQDDEHFSIAFSARYAGHSNTQLTVSVVISADASGVLTYETEALSPTGFETNRCGFCVLHPIVGLAGTPVIIEHVDGVLHETQLPFLIDPWQPFKNMRAITHIVMPGVKAECRMEGDIFEMEDQRNWSDASYKTYVRPLALPWPYRISAAVPVMQRIILTIADTRSSRNAAPSSTRHDPTVVIAHGIRSGKLPHIGLAVTPEEARATLAARKHLDEIGPQELLFHFDPLAGHGSAALEDFSAITKIHRGRSTLEIVLPCRRSAAVELNEIAAQMGAAGFQPHSVAVSPAVDRQSTPPGSVWPTCPPLDEVYEAARLAFPHVRLGGGMLSYFTELNRKRVPANRLDFITHCTNPIVHASDDRSVMQTLEALPFITKSVRGIYGDKAYRIGPSTIAMRQNPYGRRTMDNPDDKRITMACTDPRHNGAFARAFAMAYAIRVLDAELECLTLSALTGSFGLIAGNAEPVAEGGKRPLFHTVRWLAAVAEADWQECVSSDPGQVLSFVVRKAEGSCLCLVNITSKTSFADVSAFNTKSDQGTGHASLEPFATAFFDLKE